MKRLILALLLVSNLAYADENSKIEIRGQINDDTTNLLDTGTITKYFATGARQMQKLSIDTAVFSALTIPAGARAVLIDVGTSTGLKLKGVTADVGISMSSVVPVLIPISYDLALTTIGILNTSATSKEVKIFWF